MPQRRHIYVHAEEGKEGTGNDIMSAYEELESPNHGDPRPERSDVHQEESADDDERQKQEHDDEVTQFLDSVELII